MTPGPNPLKSTPRYVFSPTFFTCSDCELRDLMLDERPSSAGRTRHASPMQVPKCSGGLVTDNPSPLDWHRSSSSERKVPSSASKNASTISRDIFKSNKNEGRSPLAESKRVFTPQNRRLPSESSKTIADGEWSFTQARRSASSPGWDPFSPPKSDEDTGGTKKVIEIAVRVRPFTIGERAVASRRVLSTNGSKTLVIVNPSVTGANPDNIAAEASATSSNEWAKSFCFDHCLWSYNPEDAQDIYVDQAEVYSMVGMNLASSVMKGCSAVCLAYGHTGTG